jgi:hypothetical protein
MNNSNQAPTPDPNPPKSSPGAQDNTPPHVFRDWREQRRAERIARWEARWQRRSGRSYGWIAGAFLILIGVIYLLANFGVSLLLNWWALFILLPAFWAFVVAWDNYQDNGRLTWRGVRSLTLGVLAIILVIAFLLNLDVALYWPLLLILGGLFLLGMAFFPRSHD